MSRRATARRRRRAKLGGHKFRVELPQRLDLRSGTDKAADVVAAADKGFHQVQANEASSAGNENARHATSKREPGEGEPSRSVSR
jgi:hypothetical protein